MLKLTTGFEISNLRNGELEIFSIKEQRSILFSGGDLLDIQEKIRKVLKVAFVTGVSVSGLLQPILETYFRKE